MPKSPTDEIELEAKDRRFTALTAGDGPPVLCLHGFPDHNRSYRHQLPALAQAGYQAVSPMLRGYEPKSQGGKAVPEFHPVAMVDDVVEMASQLGDGKPIHIVGHDWGAVLTYLATTLHPKLFRSATTIAVSPFHSAEAGIRNHLNQILNSWYMIFFQLRFFSDRFVQAFDFALIEKLWRDWSPGWQIEPDEMEALKKTFRQPDVLWCALAYYRSTLNPLLSESKRLQELARMPITVPTLVISGATDGCMEPKLFDYINPEMFPSGYRSEQVDGGGHFVHQEKPAEVNALIINWLKTHT